MEFKILQGVRSKIFALIIWLFWTLQGYSQGKHEEVTIIAPFEPEIAESRKINFKPEPDSLTSVKPKFNYGFQSRPYNFGFQPEPAKSPQFVEKHLDSVKNNYLKIGAGNYATTLVDFYTHFRTGQNTTWNASVNHRASSGIIKNYGFPGNSFNRLLIGAQHQMDGSLLGGNISYNRQVVQFYGYDTGVFPDSLITKEDTEQRFKTIGAVLKLENNPAASDEYFYRGKIGFSNLADLYQARETMADIEVEAGKKPYAIGKKNSYQLYSEMSLKYFDFSDSLSEQNSLLFQMNPGIKFLFGPFTLNAGIRLAYTHDTTSKLFVYPAVSAGLIIVPSILQAYGEFSGETRKNSFHSFSGENPFINTNQEYFFSNTRFQAKFGIKGNLMQITSFHIGASHSEISDMPFFLNEANFEILTRPNGIYNRFRVVYDRTWVTTFFAEAESKIMEGIDISGKITYTKYKTDFLEKPWHKPALEVWLDGNWQISSKIKTGAGVYFIGRKFAQTRILTDDIPVEIKPVLDVSLTGEYQVSDRILAFFNLNNITSGRNYWWYNYPSYRLNVLAGVKFSL